MPKEATKTNMLKPLEPTTRIDFEYKGVTFHTQPMSRREHIQFQAEYGDVLTEIMAIAEENDANRKALEVDPEFVPETKRSEADNAKFYLRMDEMQRYLVRRKLKGWTGWTVECVMDGDKLSQESLDLLDLQVTTAIANHIQETSYLHAGEKGN